MKPMLEGEFRRFGRARWFIRKLMIIVPLVAIFVAVTEQSLDAACVAALVLIQNALALWVIAQYEYKRW